METAPRNEICRFLSRVVVEPVLSFKVTLQNEITRKAKRNLLLKGPCGTKNLTDSNLDGGSRALTIGF